MVVLMVGITLILIVFVFVGLVGWLTMCIMRELDKHWR